MSLPFDDGQIPPASAETALTQLRIAHLAGHLPVHRAFHWLHLHQPQLRLWQLEMLAIAAPPFQEAARAAWFAERFRALGLDHVHLDEEGNVLGELRPHRSSDQYPDRSRTTENEPVVLLSAHLDTVFPAGTDTVPREEGPRILGPGACDNGAGLTALLAIIACLRFAQIAPPATILFAANVGEEGEGDLRGMRHLFTRGPYRGRIRAALALEGAGTSAAVNRALGSRRFRVTISGPGGHSWTDAGAPNPIMLLSRALVLLQQDVLRAQQQPDAPRTVLSPGQITGGTAINVIPEQAAVTLDLRSVAPEMLERWTLEIHRTFEAVVADENRLHGEAHGAALLIEAIGNRPAAELSVDSALMHTVRAVDRHLGLRTELRLGSTDANLPLSLDTPALALSAGGSGGGIHTLGEWYDPTGRETALRRILLVLLDTAAHSDQWAAPARS